MGFHQRVVCVLFLAAIGGAASAKDFYWNCTTADGLKYADASQCDKGDAGVKVVKGTLPTRANDPLAAPAPGCPAVPAYCAQPDYGVADTSARAQAITHFMRQKECAFLLRFPQRCVRPD